MAKRNNAYWQKRMGALENEQHRRAEAYYRDVQEQFHKASDSIQRDIERWYQRLADNNGISYASAKRLLKDDELKEFKWTVEQYVKAGKENALDQRWMKELENASAKFHINRLQAMQLQIRQHAELLFKEYESGVTDFLHQSYGEQFYRTAYEISRGTGVGFNLARIDERKIDALIKHPWAQDGASFSDRIWINKEKLVRNLHTELSQCIIRGESPQKAVSRLAKTMGVSQSQAANLILTESAAISSIAQKDCFRELDVEQYQFDATLDGKTCETCGAMDQKVFRMSEFEIGITAPPIHPRCRCCIVPYFDDWEELGIDTERAARDPDTGKTVWVDGSLNYGEWKKRFWEGDEKGYEFTLTSAMKAAVIKYVSPDAYALNDKLRRDAELTEAEKQWIMDLDDALGHIPEYGGDLNRAVNISDPGILQEFLDEFVEDELWNTSQYLSTSKEKLYDQDAPVQIFIQGSHRGHDLGRYNDAEKEVLYERGVKFKVLQKVLHEGKWYIVLEEM